LERTLPRVVVGLTAALAAEVEQGARAVVHGRLGRVVRAAGTVLLPQGLRSLDDDVVWFSAETDTDADALAQHLLAVPGVVAAYVSAPEGPADEAAHDTAPAPPTSPIPPLPPTSPTPPTSPKAHPQRTTQPHGIPAEGPP